jgi:hypothetical protein
LYTLFPPIPGLAGREESFSAWRQERFQRRGKSGYFTSAL